MPLRSSIQKVSHAEKHIQALYKATTDWHSDPPYVLFGSSGIYEPGQPYIQYDFEIASVREPPETLGLIVGDVLTNLRAALDHIAWQLAILNLGREPTSEEALDIHFPIAMSYRKFKTARIVRKGYLTHAQQLVIRRHQPYRLKRYTPHLQALAVLNQLVNADKHRITHGVVVTAHESGVRFEAEHGEIMGEKTVISGPLDAGKPLGSVVLNPTGPNPSVHIAEMPIDVNYGDGDIYVRVSGLQSIARTVTGVILDCLDLFPGEAPAP